MKKVVVVTGGTAGVGRAAAEAFARKGCKVGVIARGQDRLDETAEALRRMGATVCAVSADVADAAALERAADRIELELGPIDVWVNNAMATVFAPVDAVTPQEFLRGTQVTYLGTVHGTMTALRRMKSRRRGTIVNVGSALAYRSVPLQSVYCGAKHAILGFTDSLRSELIHDRSRVHLTMVHLAAMNTPQFGWALNKLSHKVQPVPPIYQPEVAARAIVFAAFHRRREIWVGFPTVKAILGNKIAPGLLDLYLARAGYSGQITNEPRGAEARGNLFEPAPGRQAAHGRFDARARPDSWEMFTSRHRIGLTAGLLAMGVTALDHWLKRRFQGGSRCC